MMNIIKTDTLDQNHHNKHLFNILKENQMKKIIKKHLITIITKETAIEVIPLEDQDKISKIIQKMIDLIQDQIQDQYILTTQIDLTVHTNQDQDMIPIKIKIEITVKIITTDLPIEIIIQITILNLHIELILDKDSDQDHKRQTQISIDITVHIDHLQDHEMIIIHQDHHRLQDKILKE